ncbi:MAG: hypothetical protein ACKVTZ_13160 [Bacteroidia bacterium]
MNPTQYISIASLGLLLISSCTSSDRYNDLRHANTALRDTIGREKMLNKQLQAYIDQHIGATYSGGHISMPTSSQDIVAKDTEIRSLRVELNRVKRELEYNKHLVANYVKSGDGNATPFTPAPSGDVPDEPPQDNQMIVPPSKFTDTIGRGRLKKK